MVCRHRTGPITAPVAVVATGMANTPYRPSWPGSETYRGATVHSSEYRNPAPYLGKRVLVVGFGNSGGEIALDLAEAGVDVALAVRGPVQILPRDLLGLPILTWAIFYRHLRLPARVVDLINAPVLRLALGSMESLGLRRASKGPSRMVAEDGRIPLIDVGTLGRIRDGSIKIRGGIERLTNDGAVFDDGKNEVYDAIVLATGFHPDLRRVLPDVDGVLDTHGTPLVAGQATGAPGLFLRPDRLTHGTIARDRYRGATPGQGRQAISDSTARRRVRRLLRRRGHPYPFLRRTSYSSCIDGGSSHAPRHSSCHIPDNHMADSVRCPALANEAFIAQLTSKATAAEQSSAHSTKTMQSAAMLALPVQPKAVNSPVANAAINTSAVTQIGANNIAAVSQTGSGNASSIMQHGNGNQAMVTQRH